MIAVCIPALNEASTIAAICEAAGSDSQLGVSELVVIDGGSTDGTQQAAEAAGARVAGPPERPGKGAALYESILQTESEIVVWCDADLTSFTPDIIARLAEPLAENPETMLVKGFYESRQLQDQKSGGGRTTWLMARPLLSLLFPELAHIKEPLSGEYAIRRTAALQVPFVCNYGVEIGLLIDIASKFGAESIAETNLGTRRHNNRPLEDLSIQALEILQAAIIKSALGQDQKSELASSILRRPGLAEVEVAFEELPPIGSAD